MFDPFVVTKFNQPNTILPGWDKEIQMDGKPTYITYCINERSLIATKSIRSVWLKQVTEKEKEIDIIFVVAQA